MQLHFTKMEGLGNDYIYFDGINQEIPMDKEFITKISDRHFGIGSDGMIVILPSDKYDFKMRMFNLDGSEAMMCGNGIRCFAKFIYDHQLSDKRVLKVETKSGLRVVELLFKDDKCVGAKVDMGKPILTCKDIPCTYDSETMINEVVTIGDHDYPLTTISMGNPHAIVYVDDVKNLPIEKIGPLFEKHERFPNRVNTEFVKVLDRNTVEMRVWERGSGETLACGTGACATAVAAVLNGHCNGEILIHLLGGDLKIEWDKETNHVFMTGPAAISFEGEINL